MHSSLASEARARDVPWGRAADSRPLHSLFSERVARSGRAALSLFGTGEAKHAWRRETPVTPGEARKLGGHGCDLPQGRSAQSRFDWTAG